MKSSKRSAAAFAALVTATASVLAGGGVLAMSASASASPLAGAQTSTLSSAARPATHPGTFLGQFHHVKVVASTVPANGDVNPYGVAVVPRSTGQLRQGNILVSNFNNKANVQGTGTTIVQVGSHGGAKLFAKIHDPACPGGVGLTTALVALRSGWVIVGSLPTMKGNISGPGCLIVLDQWGHVRKTITGHGINGPWDMTALDLSGRGIAELFVTNVLGGILGKHHTAHGGTVQRLIITSGSHVPRLLSSRLIGSGFAARTDPNALVIGPTGVGLGRSGNLYVADTLNSRIAVIPNAIFRRSDDGTGRTVTKGGKLMGPLGLAIAPNGHIVTANGGNGNLVETTPAGKQVAVATVDKNAGGAGNLFGLAIKPFGQGVYFVDDFSMDNNLQLLF